MPEPDIQQISVLSSLLSAGGLPYLGMGLLLAIWGAFNVALPRYRVSIALQALVSLLPGVVAMFAIYAAAADYASLATSPVAPKPTEWAAVVTRAMSSGFFGILGTVLPAGLAAVAVWRYRAPSSDTIRASLS